MDNTITMAAGRAVATNALSRQINSRCSVSRSIKLSGVVQARKFRGSSTIVMVQRVEKSDAEWAKEVRNRYQAIFVRSAHTSRSWPVADCAPLSTAISQLDKTSFQVLRKKGTEPAGTGEYDKFFPKEGHFVCKGCGNPLYSAQSKFNSGCGWPAFDKCYKGALITETDMTFGMKRVEIMCGACDGHLGHVFENEGFSPTMERHCVNSVSVLYKEGPPPTPLEEEKVSTGEGGGGMFGAASYPLMLLVLAYLLSGVVGKVMDFFMGAQ